MDFEMPLAKAEPALPPAKPQVPLTHDIAKPKKATIRDLEQMDLSVGDSSDSNEDLNEPPAIEDGDVEIQPLQPG